MNLTTILTVATTVLGTCSAPGLERVLRDDFGKTEGGAEVERVTLRNAAGMSAEIITYGAIIKALNVPDGEGASTNVVLSTDSLEKFESGFGGAAAVIGRVANRIAGAKFDLEGTTYQLAANNGKNSIHGGRKGFAQSVWAVGETSEGDTESSVTLTYLSKDGEEGFPGNLTTTVTYTLTDANELRVEYRAETDRATIVNLTNHAYFNLAGGGDCLDHRLWIAAESYTPTDAELIPTGEILPVDGTPLDFSEPTRIGDRIDAVASTGGYDHNYVLGGGGEMKTAARLEDPSSGRVMEVRTTQPGVQLYTGNHLGHAGVCLETQHFADAIHHDHFPSIVVRPGEPLHETTEFAFSSR